MPNDLLRLEFLDGQPWGVMETPCFPARWYAGPLQRLSYYGNEYQPLDNRTSNFFRDLDKADRDLSRRLKEETKP